MVQPLSRARYITTRKFRNYVIPRSIFIAYKGLKHALGIESVSDPVFLSTIERMHPVVQQMVNEMCEDEKQRMKSLDQTQLGSWHRAVTTADGNWLTRGFHSKNMTLSVRNYLNGALLYYEHLCHRGRDHVVQGELYQGTSKSDEGYAARVTFQRAKDEGMMVEIQWQDSDSSSSNAVKELFPKAQVMICGGHPGRAHKNNLKSLRK